MNFDFPGLLNRTYLNTASFGLMSQSLIDWQKEQDELLMQYGSDFRIQFPDFMLEVRQALARFFGNSVEYTFLLPNFSFGFNALLDGFSKSEKFLLVDEDYPSIHYPVDSRGFAVSLAKADTHLEENLRQKIISESPSILALSLVQYTNGLKVDLEFFKTLKKEFPDLLIIADGTQFCGTAAFNFENSGIDILIASGYKWMCAGFGNGFLLIKENIAPKLFTNRVKVPLPNEAFLKGKSPLSFEFEPGHQSYKSMGALRQSVLMMESLGMDFIEEKINRIGEAAKKAFAARGLITEEVALRKQHSSIFKLQLEESLIKRLQKRNMVFSKRGGGLRVAFHFYNSPNDLDALLEAIDGN